MQKNVIYLVNSTENSSDCIFLRTSHFSIAIYSILAQNYLVVKVAHTVSSEFTAVIPDISTWSAWHALSSLYMQLCAAHFIERLSFGEPQELLLVFSLCSKLVQHVSSQEHASSPLISIPLRQQHLSELWEQVVALQLKLVIKNLLLIIIIHSLIKRCIYYY